MRSASLIAYWQTRACLSKHALHGQDFDALALTVDPWIEANGELNGVVVHVRAFPGWENIGSLVRHVQFVRDYHRKVERIALAADGALGVGSAHR